MRKRYRKKPVVVEAVQWTGRNPMEVFRFLDDAATGVTESNGIYIKTLEGTMAAQIGDYIIKGVKGEFYPCKPDIFAETYEEVENGG